MGEESPSLCGCHWNVGLRLPLQKLLAAKEWTRDLGSTNGMPTRNTFCVSGMTHRRHSISGEILHGGCSKVRILQRHGPQRQSLKQSNNTRLCWGRDRSLAGRSSSSFALCTPGFPGLWSQFCCLQPRTLQDATAEYFFSTGEFYKVLLSKKKKIVLIQATLTLDTGWERSQKLFIVKLYLERRRVGWEQR